MAGSELRRRRGAARQRQVDVAAAVGVTQTAVAQWERSSVPDTRRADVERALPA